MSDQTPAWKAGRECENVKKGQTCHMLATLKLSLPFFNTFQMLLYLCKIKVDFFVFYVCHYNLLLLSTTIEFISLLMKCLHMGMFLIVMIVFLINFPVTYAFL